MTNPTSLDRIAVQSLLVSRAPEQRLGRTALMKLTYFLQELKEVRLGYHFTMFAYGPFDSEVLSDLATATSRDILKEETVIYAKGYGFKITPTPRAEKMASDLAAKEPELAAAVDEVVTAFGSFSAAELELRSTILFVDREFHRLGSGSTTSAITERVRQIKPYFTEPTIQSRVDDFLANGWLLSVSKAGDRPIPF